MFVLVLVFALLHEFVDEGGRDLFLVPLCDALNDDFGFFDAAVAQKPSGAFGDEPPVAEI